MLLGSTLFTRRDTKQGQGTAPHGLGCRKCPFCVNRGPHFGPAITQVRQSPLLQAHRRVHIVRLSKLDRFLPQSPFRPSRAFHESSRNGTSSAPEQDRAPEEPSPADQGSREPQELAQLERTRDLLLARKHSLEAQLNVSLFSIDCGAIQTSSDGRIHGHRFGH